MRITDMIASEIMRMLDHSGGTIRIQRNDLAHQLGCVPSQINYVITSRFTPEQGYLVESKRGGGGFIRIVRVDCSKQDLIMHIVNSLGETLDEQSARIILHNLSYDNLLQEKETKMILAAVSEQTLKTVPVQCREQARSAIVKAMLLQSTV